MTGRKLTLILTALILVPAVLYVSGIVAQLMISMELWKEAGSSYGTSPALPSLELKAVLHALAVFPEGLKALGCTVTGLVSFAVFGLGLGRRDQSGTDRERNLTISRSGSYGTADFMSVTEAKRAFEVTLPEKTDLDILGALDRKRIITLGRNTRLNENLAVCGASGTGKSRSISRNLVLQAVRRGESVILTDPKSELYESMAPYLRDQGYVVRVFNLVSMEHSDSWNCLGEVGGSELMAQTFADVVLSNTGGDRNDAFWYSAELNLLKALVLYVELELPPEERNFGKVYDLLCEEGERGLSGAMERVRHSHVDPATGEVLPPSPAYAPYSLFMQSSENVRSSVVIGLGSKLQVLQAQQVRNITTFSEIDLELPGKEKCAYFCIVSDQDATFNFLSSLFFSFLFIRIIRYADNCCEGGMLSPKVKFILDEFPNCVLIPDFTRKCSVIRSRGVSVAVFFQNVGQMRNRYPFDQWQEILGACDTTVFLGCTDILTAEYFSSRAGEASVELESEASASGTSAASCRTTHSLGKRKLMTPDEILRLPPDGELIFIRGQKPLRAMRFDYSRHPDYGKLHPEKAVLHMPAWKEEAERRQTEAAAAETGRDPRRFRKSEEKKTEAPEQPAPKRRRGRPADLDEII